MRRADGPGYCKMEEKDCKDETLMVARSKSGVGSNRSQVFSPGEVGISTRAMHVLNPSLAGANAANGARQECMWVVGDKLSYLKLSVRPCDPPGRPRIVSSLIH